MKRKTISALLVCGLLIVVSQVAQAQSFGVGFGSFGPGFGSFGPSFGYGPGISLGAGPALSYGRAGYGNYGYRPMYSGYSLNRYGYNYGPARSRYVARRPAACGPRGYMRRR